ncbi:hypothetical protein K1T71_004617 [Dendrolimus kikuchii]|uniref:Uncharacterized protein n=1 Tax=Dendrolimus kikuchii TaxID=765133 RepID=A0ACC1D7Z8_9NEOP|nr:hypothetical protein K1T71_004617 [Dendrolimus kikuchii]
MFPILSPYTKAISHLFSGREPTPECHECGAPLDTALHTLVECATWGPQRSQMEKVVGPVRSLENMVKAMLSSKRYWSEVASFCESVMTQKEARKSKQLSIDTKRMRLKFESVPLTEFD